MEGKVRTKETVRGLVDDSKSRKVGKEGDGPEWLSLGTFHHYSGTRGNINVSSHLGSEAQDPLDKSYLIIM